MRPRRAALALLLFLALVVGLGSPARAQEASTAVTVEQVNTAGEPGLLVMVSPAEPGDLAIDVNGTAASIVDVASVRDTTVDIHTMIVIDNAEAGRTDDADRLALRAEAAVSMVKNAALNESIGVVSTGGGAKLRVGLDASHAKSQTAIERIADGGPSALWDAVRLAGIELSESDAVLKRLIIIADQPDLLSTVAVPSARAEVLSAGAATYVLTVAGESLPLADLEALTAATNGGFVTAESFEAIPESAATLEDLIDNRYVIGFSSESLYAGNDLTMHVNGFTAAFNMVPGSTTSGRTLSPLPATNTIDDGFFGGKQGLMIGLAMGAVAAAMMAYACGTLIFKSDELSNILSAYGTGREIEANSARAIYERAIRATGALAERRGKAATLQAKLDQADLAMKPAEAMAFGFAITLTTGVLGFVLTRSPLITVLAFAVGVVLPSALLKHRVKARKKEFVAQLPPMLQLLASTLKAGYSFMQGIEAVSREVDGPMGKELRRIVSEAQLGRPVEDALAASASRMECEDFEWVVMAVEIQREVGGNLSEVLMTVADTMLARERLRGEVAALTAEGKISAIVLGGLPPSLGFAMYVINPEYIATLFQETIGMILLGVAVVSALIGFAWMKKIITIEI